MASIAVYLIIMLVLAVVIIFVCIYAYNRRMDKITSGELRDTHSSIPEPGTTVSAVYKIVLMAIVIITFFMISSANGKLNTLQNQLRNMESQQNQMTSQIYDLERQLEESGKRVKYSDYEILNPDYEARTADVKVTVSLNEYADDTEIFLNMNGKEVPLTKSAAGTWSGQFTANFFEEFAEPLICIREGGRTVTEYADFPEYIFWNFIPTPNLECKFDSDVNAAGKLKYEGWYRILLDDPKEIESASITYMTDGRDLKTMDITDEVRNRTEITLEKGLDLKKDLTFRIELVTKSGYKVENQIMVVYDATQEFDSDYLKIMDLQGNVLWEDANY